METSFVLICWGATFGGVGTLIALMLRRARALAEHVPAEDRPWS